MRKAISIWSFPEGIGYEEAFKLAKEAGFEGVEVALAEEGELSLQSTEAEVKALREKAERAGVEIHSVATGLFRSYPFTSEDPRKRERAMEVAGKLLQVANWLGVDAVLVVPGAVFVPWAEGSEVVPYDVAYRRAQEALRELAPEAERLGVTICVENVWNFMLLSPLEMARFVDEIGSERVQVYFDVGNVVAFGFPEHWIRILGGRIKRVHFKDYRRVAGGLHGFVDLLEGDVNWPEVMKAFKEVGYDGWATAEMIPTYATAPEQIILTTSRHMDAIFKMADV